MNEFFRGYIQTHDKQAIEKFKNRTDFKSLDEVQSLPEYAGILANDAILIDVDNYEQSEKLLDIVDDLGVKCLVIGTTRGKHFYFKNTKLDTCKTHNQLACGLTADIKVGVKNTYSILKFNNKERPILYDKLDDEEYDEVPKWLYPVKSAINFLQLGEGDGRNQTLFNYILTLQSAEFSAEEVKETIGIINNYILKNPLPKGELETILRDDAFNKPSFYKGNHFLFDKFAVYLKNNYHIIKINNQLHMYIDGVYVDGYTSIESEMIKLIPDLNRQKRSEVMAYLELLAPSKDIATANYIAFKNGIYDIENDKLIDFNPNIIITNKINFDYNPKAYNELVDKSLNKLACNDDDIRALLEEVVGYCLYRRNELRKSFILIGDKANGKSTFLDMIKTLLGEENTVALDLKELGDRFKTAELFNKLANIGDDIGDEWIPNPAIFKKLVSGDRVNAERKGRDPFNFSSYAKLLFSANSLPRIGRGRGSEAIIDRLIIVPFNAKFSKDDPDYDPYIKYKLRQPQAIEYLIQLGISGLKRVLKNNGFTINAAIQKELEEYEENNNPIIGFFKEINIDDIINNQTNAIFTRYKEYCLSNNFNAISKIEFTRQVNKYFDLEIKVKKIQGKPVKVFAKK